MTNEEIERVASDVLVAHNIMRPPVDPFEIAKLEGIKLLPGEYDGCFDGRIEYRRSAGDGRFYLFYAEETPSIRPPGRVRFSIAHELGHFYIPKHRSYLLSGVWHGSHSGFVSDKPVEREADLFAAAFLMPRDWFVERVERNSDSICTMADLERLATSVFDTSITSTVIRYVQLDFEACCAVLSREGQILFSIPSDTMRRQGLGWLPKGSRVPASTVTGKAVLAVSRGESPTAEGRMDADAWFDGKPARRLWEDVRFLGGTGLALTLLALDEGGSDD